MTTHPTRFVLGCGDVIAVAGTKGFGDGIRAAVMASAPKLHLLERRFSAQAAVVVSPDSSAAKGITRQAVERSIPVMSEHEALEAVALLNEPVEPGWCECAAPVLPPERTRTWEHHELGLCGWPERRCSAPEHRKSWCRACRRVLRFRFCPCGGGWEFSYDGEREWWVHAVCGWPTREWFAASGARVSESVDGAPSWLWQPHEVRKDIELKVRPLPESVGLKDRELRGKLVED